MHEQRILLEAPKFALNRIEAARALSVSVATLDRLANRGLILPCRATGRPLYSIAEIERFLRETTVEINPLQRAAGSARKASL
jgi:hypothetical protein